MMQRNHVLACLLSMVVISALASPGWAQQASGIAGVVTDSSGAVMPGVTVEAASPALIEKVRSVVTDNAGRYNIIDLRPGTYSLVFSLTGFNTLRREGIVLTVGFTGTVNAAMQVGALEESVTVSGVSPLVDTQSTQQQQVFGNDALNALPTGLKGLATLPNVVPGLRSGTADVGGANGLYAASVNGMDMYHGKSGTKLTYDGMQINNLAGTGGNTNYILNFATVQEIAVETGGVSAESDANNVRVNLVPKEGGNTYHFDTTYLFSNDHLQSDNLTDDLRSRRVTNLPKVLLLTDANITFGGPVKRDRLWFFSATRRAESKNRVPNVYFNSTQGTPFYTPDLNRPLSRQNTIASSGGRITWQAAQKHKISSFVDFQSTQIRGQGDLRAPEAQTRWNYWPLMVLQTGWSSPQTNRLLLEAVWSAALYPNHNTRQMTTDNLGFVVSPNDVSIFELSTGFRYNAAQTYYGDNGIHNDRHAARFAASYVTGSHAFKTGFQFQHAIASSSTVVNKDVNYNFLLGVPNAIVQYATPYETVSKINELGMFVQDRWTINRLTVNLGLRLDYFKGNVPAQQLPATPSGWIPERNFAPVTRVPEWIDLNPRVGASYDVFGNGRTAVKASFSRYVGQMTTTVANNNNPIVTSILNVTRTWSDANQNYSPDCNLGNFAQNGECGPISNQNFGKNNPLATRYDDSIVKGFGVRDYFWDFLAEVQQQLGPTTSLTFGYDHSWTHNPQSQPGLIPFNPSGVGPAWSTGVTRNLAVTPADYSPYCITAPSNPFLPNGGGYPVCGLYDVSPQKFGRIDNVVTSQEPFGNRYRNTDFFSASLSKRLSSRLTLGTSADTGRTVEDNCFVVNSPQDLLNCRRVTAFKEQTLFKANATYQFPRDFTVSGVFQNLPGVTYGAEYVATNAQIAPSLGRNLAACGTQAVCNATLTVPLVPYGVLFEPRRSQIDLQFGKGFSLTSRMKVHADVSIYNVLNASNVYAVISAYGPLWRTPLSNANFGNGFMDGRLVHFGGRVTW